MGRWTVLAALAGALVCGASAAPAARASVTQPEGVVLRPRLEEGRRDRYEIAATLSTETAAEGREPQRESVEQKVLVRTEVLGVDRLGVARVSVRLERAEVTYAAPGERAETFAWAEGEEGAQRVLPLEVMYLKLAQEGLELQVGPDGTVRSVAGLEEVIAAGEGMTERSRARALGVFAPGAAGQSLSGIWRIDPGERPVRRAVGDVWRIQRLIPLGPAGSAAVVTACTLTAVEDGLATVEGRTSVTVRPQRGEPDPAQPSLAVEGEGGTLRVVWDVEAGALREREGAGSVRWTATLGMREPMAAATAMSERLTIRRVEGRPDGGAAPADAEGGAPDRP